MTVGSLFSGIGGLDLGFEWAGFKTIWFCEIEKYPQEVLAKHWPGVPIIEDVRNVTKESVQRPDVIVGGFPCQDISWAGRGAGIDYNLSEQDGTRSGLWWEMWRVIRELRPRYVCAENVPALTHRGLDVVLGSLAQIGYDAEWQTISAAAVGAPHIRERVFIVAYRQGDVSNSEGAGRSVSNPDDVRKESREDNTLGNGSEVLADTYNPRPQGRGEFNGPNRYTWASGTQPHPVSFRDVGDPPNSDVQGKRERAKYTPQDQQEGGGQSRRANSRTNGVGRLEIEYDFRGVAYGVPDRVHRLKGLGNAVVPQVGYLVASAIRKHIEENANIIL